MFLEISVADLTAIYNQNRLFSAKTAVFGMSMIIAAVITIVKFYKEVIKNVLDDSQTTISVRVLRLLKPLIPFYIVLGMLPLISTTIENGIQLVINETGVSNLNTVNGYDTALAQKQAELEDKKLEYLVEYLSGNALTKLRTYFKMAAIDMRLGFLYILSALTGYLLAFALGAYFLWLIVLEMFAPIAALGLVFKEITPVSQKWISHYISAKLFLVMIYLSNAISIGFYGIFDNEYDVITTGIVLILFRSFLYKQAFNLATKVI